MGFLRELEIHGFPKLEGPVQAAHIFIINSVVWRLVAFYLRKYTEVPNVLEHKTAHLASWRKGWAAT